MEWVQLFRGSVSYADGFELRRLWIGRGLGAIRIIPVRIYLDDKGVPDRRPEHKIINGLNRPSRKTESTLKFQDELLNNLLKARFAFNTAIHHEEVIPILPVLEQGIRGFDTDKIPYIIDEGEKATEAQLPYLRQVLETKN